MAKDFYQTLGIDHNSSQEEIKKAYRQKAKEYHPDRGGDVEKFKEVQEAYDTLGDEKKKQQYDTFGSSATGTEGFGSQGGFDFSNVQFDFGGGNFGGFSDMFGDFFGSSSSRKSSSRSNTGESGRDLEVEVDLTFEEACFGIVKILAMNKYDICKDCGGRGGDGETCSECHGAGSVTRIQHTILGAIQTKTSCPNCKGTGTTIKKACPECRGAGRIKSKGEVKVNIPAGIEDGNTLRMRDYGEAGERGGKSGDLFIHIRVKPHKNNWVRDGLDIHSTLKIPVYTAVLGEDVDVETIHGTRSIFIKPGTPNEKKLQLTGDGVHSKNGDRGNHIFHVEILIPNGDKLSSKERELWDYIKDINS